MEITVLFELVWEVMKMEQDFAEMQEAIDCLQEDIDRLSKEHDDYMEKRGTTRARLLRRETARVKRNERF